MKYLRQIAWHIFPTAIVFLVLLGIQLLPVTFFGVALALFGTGEIGSISASELGSLILLVVFNALFPSVGRFLIALTLDTLVRSKPVWTKIVLPFLFILAAPLLAYVWFQIPVPEDEFAWWSTLIDKVMSTLVLSMAAFVLYWYILQIQRFVVWLLKKAPRAITRSSESPNH